MFITGAQASEAENPHACLEELKEEMNGTRECHPASAQERGLSNINESLVAIRNTTRETTIGDRVEIAGSNVKRSKGLLGKKGLEPGEGMWIVPCEAVHTFFMRFPIDLIYLDKKNRVRKIRSAVPAWRISACMSAHSVLELPAGTIRESKTEQGDVLEVIR